MCIVAVIGLATLIVYHRHLTSQVGTILVEATTIALVGVGIMFNLIRDAVQSSQSLLTSLEVNCARSGYLKRRVKACIPYSIQFGSLFKAKAVTVLTVYGFIFSNAISIVILEKN